MTSSEDGISASSTLETRAESEGLAKQLTFRGSKVHDVGYRLFLLDAAYAFHIEKFEVHNLMQDGEETIVVRFGSIDPEQFAEYEAYIRSNHPQEAEVRAIENSNRPFTALQSYERTALNLQTKQLYKGVRVIKYSSEITHQKLDNLGEKMDKGFDGLGEKMDKGFNGLGEKMDKGFNGLGEKMDKGFNGLGEKMDKGFNGLGEKMDKGFNGLGEKLDDLPERIAKAMNQNKQGG